MKKKVYFAGSIRGGRQDAELYKRIIEYIQRNHTVLTEHVGDLSKSKTEGLKNRDVAIYEQDTAWLKQADVVIAECTTPSLGVGYELAYAEAHGIPFVDYYAAMVNPSDGSLPYADDGVHPTVEGYLIMESLIHPVVERMLKP